MKTENRRIRQNDEYTFRDFETMGAVLQLIIKRAERGLSYGLDMPSSRAAVLLDIEELADWTGWIADEVLKISKSDGGC